MQYSSKYSYWQTHSGQVREEKKTRMQVPVSEETRQKKFKYNPGSVFHQADRLMQNQSPTNNSCSVSESIEVIVSELENPHEYQEPATRESIFCEAMKEIAMSREASQEYLKTRNKELRIQLLKLLNYDKNIFR